MSSQGIKNREGESCKLLLVLGKLWLKDLQWGDVAQQGVVVRKLSVCATAANKKKDTRKGK